MWHWSKLVEFESRAGIAQSVEHLPSLTLWKHLIWHDRSWFWVPPMPACRHVEENGLAAMLATKRLVAVAPEVNLREHVTYMPLPSTNKAAHSGFETQRRCHQQSKTGVFVAPSKHFFKKKLWNCILHVTNSTSPSRFCSNAMSKNIWSM